MTTACEGRRPPGRRERAAIWASPFAVTSPRLFVVSVAAKDR